MGVDVNPAPCAYGVTALHSAACEGEVEAIRVLIEAGADLEAENAGGSTPLFLAVSSCKPEATAALLNHGASINTRNDHEETPLHRAVTCERECAGVMTDLLLRWGADETVVDVERMTPMDVVARKIAACAGLSGDPHGADFLQIMMADISVVRDLLRRAPADRAWRRRGFLVVCRAHPERAVPKQDCSKIPRSSAPNTRSRVKRERAQASGVDSGGGGAGGSFHGACVGGNLPDLPARVPHLGEEVVFRMIIEYL